MPQLNKTSPGSNPAGKASGSKAVARGRKGRWTAFIIASVVVVLILIIVGVFYYFSEDARYNRRTTITVDDTSINMDYFVRRAWLAGADPFEMLEALTNELLIRIAAPQYVDEVSPEDIDQELRRIARGESETISESEFKEWYRQLLNEIDLSDSEYREYVATGLLANRFHEYLAERVPTVAEQVHLHAILLETYEDAEEIRARWEAGEDFADLAREVSVDEQSGEKGGDLGWLPRGVLVPGFDQVVFSLTIGEVSEPRAYVSDPTSTEIFYYLLMVSERADAREVDEDSLQILKAGVLEDWLLAEIKLHEVDWRGLKNGFDDYTYRWIQLELAKE